ncbi:trypsin-like serine peptidase [Streptomyces yaizuensis]|uniref:Secreted protein n=1 Tax=Streptomyces yaizuensis TaxID=2989713 RepID=A0ABQ5PBN1_9ACTN|nr:hypothetical protein [Streptomyces sp. YSPA8]GLF99681.1 secreted protein [Streptomyces sp. YSPA8]
MRPTISWPAAAALALAVVFTASGCGGTGGNAVKESAADAAAEAAGTAAGFPAEVAERLRENGLDPSAWLDGAWRDWDEDTWLREARDFVNPVIRDLWGPEPMTSARPPAQTLADGDTAGDQGVSDPEPRPVTAVREEPPYQRNAAPVGKVFFDGPQGAMVCSATVVKDPAAPGRSNLVWTAGHCVHAGKDGGWYRNIAFVPAYNDQGRPPEKLASAPAEEVAPYGVHWADWASTSQEWITRGGPTGGAGAPYDYAVLRVKPREGARSLEETVGTALDIDFAAPDAREISALGAWGYPAAAPFNGAIMHKCLDRPGRLSLGSVFKVASSARRAGPAGSGAVHRKAEEGVHAEHRRLTTTQRGAVPGHAGQTGL